MAVKRFAVKSATFKFGDKTFDMETGPVMKAETREAVEVTALSDAVKRFIPGALKEVDEFTVSLYMTGAADITVDSAPAALRIEVVIENGESEDVSFALEYPTAIVTKVAPSQIQASSDRKALYDVTIRPDGSDAAAQTDGSDAAAQTDG